MSKQYCCRSLGDDLVKMYVPVAKLRTVIGVEAYNSARTVPCSDSSLSGVRYYHALLLVAIRVQVHDVDSTTGGGPLSPWQQLTRLAQRQGPQS